MAEKDELTWGILYYRQGNYDLAIKNFSDGKRNAGRSLVYREKCEKYLRRAKLKAGLPITGEDLLLYEKARKRSGNGSYTYAGERSCSGSSGNDGAASAMINDGIRLYRLGKYEDAIRVFSACENNNKITSCKREKCRLFRKRAELKK